jgi:hypothetical protein
VPLGSTPTYYALSYSWGDPTPVAPYEVNGSAYLNLIYGSLINAYIYIHFTVTELSHKSRQYHFFSYTDTFPCDPSILAAKGPQSRASRIHVY